MHIKFFISILFEGEKIMLEDLKMLSSQYHVVMTAKSSIINTTKMEDQNRKSSLMVVCSV